MPLYITCYGGAGEIGGNKILLEDGALRVFLDFGRPFGRHTQYFDGLLIKERSVRGLLDPMILELLPPLEGLYRDDLIPVMDSSHLTIKGEGEKKQVERNPKAYDDFWKRFRHKRGYRNLQRDDLPVNAILISHAHLDHSGDLVFVRPEIPVLSSLMTAIISKAVQDSGKPGSAGVVYINPQAIKEDGALEGDRTRGYVWRNWNFLDQDPQGDVQKDNPFASTASFWHWRPAKQDKNSTGPSSTQSLQRKPEWWPLDHSIFGACGFALETSEGWIAYTGDIRFNGSQGFKSWKFAEELAALKPLALICEGTYLGVENPHPVTEEKVQANCLEIIRKATGKLIIADFAPRNIERLIAFLNIARDTSRRLVIQAKDAYLLSAMHLVDPYSVPDLKNESFVAIFNDPKARRDKWEEITRQFYSGKLVNPSEIGKEPGDYILAFSLWDIADLLDLEHLEENCLKGGVYIYSNSRAYDEEQKVDLIRLWNWIDHFGMKPVGLTLNQIGEVDIIPGYHASGHASESELVRFVKEVCPRVLIPIHTEQPQLWEEKLRGTGIQIKFPSYANPILLP